MNVNVKFFFFCINKGSFKKIILIFRVYVDNWDIIRNDKLVYVFYKKKLLYNFLNIIKK